MLAKPWLCGLVAAWLAASACAVGADDAGPTGSCVPGASVTCPCADGTLSSRVCDPSGSAFAACACSAAPAVPGASTAGMGGAAAAPMIGTGTAGTGPSPDSEGPDADPGLGAAGMGGAATAGTGAPASPSSSPGGAIGDDGVPTGEHCANVANWDPIWTQFEEEVLLLTNEARARGATCGEHGSFPAAGPLAMNAELRCSARLHSLDMGEAGYFAHESQDGDDPFERMSEAGYEGRLMGENIAKGQQSPDEVVEGWLESPGHCANIMNDGFSDIGIGYWEGEAESQWFNGNKLWTQNFGAPSSGGGSCPWGPQFCG